MSVLICWNYEGIINSFKKSESNTIGTYKEASKGRLLAWFPKDNSRNKLIKKKLISYAQISPYYKNN
jgi:hypothetical protein